MQSPVDPQSALQQTTLEGGLVAYACPALGGHWIPAENYWRWQNSLPDAEDLPDPE